MDPLEECQIFNVFAPQLCEMSKAAMYWKLEKLEYSKLNYLDHKLWRWPRFERFCQRCNYGNQDWYWKKNCFDWLFLFCRALMLNICHFLEEKAKRRNKTNLKMLMMIDWSGKLNKKKTALEKLWRLSQWCREIW